mgnify:CR=1 FL=1
MSHNEGHGTAVAMLVLHGRAGATTGIGVTMTTAINHQLARTNRGYANQFILSHVKYKADFTRVEVASIKRTITLTSGEAKRVFVRCFYSYQVNMYFINAMGRVWLSREYVQAQEEQMHNCLDVATQAMEADLVWAESLCKQHGLHTLADYDIDALHMEVSIISNMGRRYYELILKFDLLVTMLQTLHIEGHISECQQDSRRSTAKRHILELTSIAREFNRACRAHITVLNEANLARRPQVAKSATAPGNNARAAIPQAPQASQTQGSPTMGTETPWQIQLRQGIRQADTHSIDTPPADRPAEASDETAAAPLVGFANDHSIESLKYGASTPRASARRLFSDPRVFCVPPVREADVRSGRSRPR